MKTRMTALELILHLAEGSTTPNTLQHITKIAREALAEQPAQQEPVAWMQDSIELYVQDRPSATYTVPLYTTPQPPAQPLTDEQIWKLAANCLDSVAGRMQFARAIEAAHGITKGNT